MNPTLFSEKYEVRKLTHDDVDDIYQLCRQNKMYYDYRPPFVTKQAILDDMNALPRNKTTEDKFYIGFYNRNQLIAVMDLINHYPAKNIAFIGFFMMDISLQTKGIGSQIIGDLCKHLTDLEYEAVRLCWVKENPQAEHFWEKNNFIPIEEIRTHSAEHVIVAERTLVKS